MAQEQPVREFAKDMKSELHVTPTVRNVVLVSLLAVVFVLGTCVLFNPLAIPPDARNPVQEGAEHSFEVAPPTPAAEAPIPLPIPTPPPVSVAPPSSSGNKAPPDVYTPPPSP